MSDPPEFSEDELPLEDRSVEDRAVKFVIDQERLQGRKAIDTRRQRGHADIESEERIIEVKSFGKRGLRTTGRLVLSYPELRRGFDIPNYYVYVVENVEQPDQSKIELRVLHGDHLREIFGKAKPLLAWVPVHVSDYGRLRRVDGSAYEPSPEPHARARRELRPDEDARRLKKNAALRKWRSEHREQVSAYMKAWREKRKREPGA